MKKITILFMFCFVQMITGQNIISNGDFESSWASTFPWNENTGAATIVSDDTGSGSTDVLNIPSGAYQFEQVIEVSPGVTYEIFVRYKWINATAAGTYSTPVIRRGLTGTTGISLSGGPIIFAGDAGPEVTKLNVWRTKGTATFTVPSGVFKARLYYNRGAAGANIRFDDIEIKVKPDITWTGGASDGDLANTANWDGGVNPTATDVVLIPSGLTSYPTTGNITADEIFVNHGATFITTGTVTGGMHFYTKVEDTDWHLLSSVGTVQNPNNNWMAANGTASGSLSNKGIASYQNGTADGTTGNWVYNQVGHSGAMDAGKGYSMKRAVPGLYTFNGLYNQAPEAINITSDVNAWNLIANPFSSYMNIATFLSDNTTKLSGAYQSVYVWNASTSSYEDLTMGHIHPGQAFFVNSATASETVNITAAMESHQPGVTFYRNSNPSINIIASSNNLEKK
ncbi:MAG: hypothetical protein AB8B78_05060 [Polaribacter sp.]